MNHRKAIEAAAFFLSLAGGKMQLIRLMKLLYIADRTFLLDHGALIFHDAYVAMPYGPVLSKVYDMTKPDAERTLAGHAWRKWIVSTGKAHELQLTEPMPEAEALSRFEIQTIELVHRKYAALGDFEIVDDIVHNPQLFPEWSDPGRSSKPITYSAVLQKAGNRSSGDAERLDDFLRSVIKMQRLSHG